MLCALVSHRVAEWEAERGRLARTAREERLLLEAAQARERCVCARNRRRRCRRRHTRDGLLLNRVLMFVLCRVEQQRQTETAHSATALERERELELSALR